MKDREYIKFKNNLKYKTLKTLEIAKKYNTYTFLEYIKGNALEGDYEDMNKQIEKEGK